MGLVVGGVATLAGGLMGSSAAKTAAGQQSAALQNALNFSQGVYSNAQANLSPFISGGTNALSSLEQLYGLGGGPAGYTPGAIGGVSQGQPSNALQAYTNFTQTPFYQFPLSQGVAALNQSGAARGLTLSGGQANALQAYGQGYASQNFNSYINALSGLANLGQQSAGALAGYGNQASNTQLTGQSQLGQAQSAGTIGSQQAIANNVLGAIPSILGYGGTKTSYGNQAQGGLVGNAGNILSNLFGGGGSGNQLGTTNISTGGGLGSDMATLGLPTTSWFG